MKDWIDITAQIPRGDTSKNRRESSVSETADFRVADLPTISLDIIRLLLTGLMSLLGLTRQERYVARERAIRVRRAIADANEHVDTLWNNRDVYETWSGCGSLHWGAHMIKCWNYKCPKSRERENPHREKARYFGVPGQAKREPGSHSDSLPRRRGFRISLRDSGNTVAVGGALLIPP